MGRGSRASDRGDSVRGPRGNFVSEWFGHRVFPTVAALPNALSDQQAQRCPFLSLATETERKCIKPAQASGICTIATASGGVTQDWLVCPYRAFETSLLADAVQRVFQTPAAVLRPAPTLSDPVVQALLRDNIDNGGASFVYLTDKLGGEIQLGATERSPQMAFDVTVVELLREDKRLVLGRYGVLEIQTMDFHGSYKHAVKDLEDALRLHGDRFHAVLAEHQHWLSKEIEGPNIANVFKRTFYQMVLKFQLGGHGACAGTVMAVPVAVWNSWQRHLGSPTLVCEADGTYSLMPPERVGSARAWIYVFDIESAVALSPARIRLAKVIATDAETITKCALQSAPQALLAEGGAADRILASIQQRLVSYWPQLSASTSTTEPG